MHGRELRRYLWGNCTEPSGNFSRPRQVSSEPSSEIIIMGDKEKMSEVGIGPSSILWPLTNETIAVRLQVACSPFQMSGERARLPKENSKLSRAPSRILHRLPFPSKPGSANPHEHRVGGKAGFNTRSPASSVMSKTGSACDG